MHLCDNPPCVNPAHLFLGDDAINAADKVSKGRQRGGGNRSVGAANGSARLCEVDVLAIRASAESAIALGARFGVSPRHVERIRRREKWAHI